jgi:hypothetical protein
MRSPRIGLVDRELDRRRDEDRSGRSHDAPPRLSGQRGGEDRNGDEN